MCKACLDTIRIGDDPNGTYIGDIPGWTPTPIYPQPWIAPNSPSPVWFPTDYKLDINTSAETVAKDEDSAADITRICDELKELLLEKNRKYGDSALSPSRIFSKSDAVEQIKVRIDDKLTRLRNQQDDEDEDVVWDLMGYLILLRIAQERRNNTSSKG